jgi:coenzyme F420-dependent glucose-6-phosphate dehydrogenase
MVEIGYKLSSEEHRPNDLVRYAAMAEDAGFTFALISDHYHPWIDTQGQSPFVWCVIGGVAQSTKRLRLGTGVTCPTVRMHPAIVAQATATAAAMLEGRFFFGVGAGENLNEHVVGQGWPETEVRQERLREAVEVIRMLWRGGYQSHHGRHYTVENARLYTLPQTLPPLMIAAGGPKSAQAAATLGDGLIGTSPDKEMLSKFDAAGGRGKPKIAEITVCWAPDERSARRTAHQWWPTAAMESSLAWELPLPKHFEDVAKLVTEDAVAETIICGPDVERHVDGIKKYADAGYDQICVHHVGPDQQGCLKFYEHDVLPRLRKLRAAA